MRPAPKLTMKKFITELAWALGAVAIVVAVFLVIFFAPISVDASPPTFIRIATTGGTGANASTSASYMTGGTGTTTLTYDAYAASGTGEVDGQMTFTANIQIAAPSTATTYCRSIQLSHDGVDWYPFTSSSTSNISSGLGVQCWNFSSSSASLAAGSPVSATTTTSVQIPILDRFTRVLFYIPVGSPRGALWAEAIGIKQRI